MIDCSISIIIPAYNVEKYLGEALDSIQEQSEYPDEVILIDDGSIDQTLAIANSYNFPFSYHVLSIENNGQGNARNIGVDLATSKYIYYFDSDDILDRCFIETIKNKIRDSEFPDIILFSGKSFNDSEYQGERWVDYTRGFSGVFHNRVTFLNQGVLRNGLFCSPCLYVSKRRLWGEKGLRFGKDFLEDEAIFYPLLFLCQSFCVLNKVFFYRRNRNGSTMTIKPNSKHVKGALNCIESALELYNSKGVTNQEQWHIKKRLESSCLSYISTAKAANIKISYKKIYDVLLVTRNTNFSARIAIYITGANKIYIIRKTARAIKNISSRGIKRHS